MCTRSCLDFVATNLSDAEITGRSVIEVGALDVNGSARSLVKALNPGSYLGVDMQAGPGVGEICPAEKLIEKFGENRFDIVLTTEMLEHVFDWRTVLHNLKGILKPGGLLLVTTRSIGFGYHAYPYDFWRYQVEDMKTLFDDFQILNLVDDPLSPGVFVKARKPANFTENDLTQVALHSMITSRRSLNVTEKEISSFHFCRRLTQPFRSIEKGLRRIRDMILRK